MGCLEELPSGEQVVILRQELVVQGRYYELHKIEVLGRNLWCDVSIRIALFCDFHLRNRRADFFIPCAKVSTEELITRVPESTDDGSGNKLDLILKFGPEMYLSNMLQ